MKRLIFLVIGSLFYWTAQAQLGPGVAWHGTYGGDGPENGLSVVQLADSGFVVFGNTGSSDFADVPTNHGIVDFWVLWLDKLGWLTRSKCYGGSQYEVATKMLPLSSGGCVLFGYTNSNDGDVSGFHGGGSDFWVVRLDDTGAIVWQRCLGGTNVDYPYGMDTTRDGGIIVCGATASNDGDVSGNHGNTDAWVVKLDANGDIDWQRCLGGSQGDMAFSVRSTDDGGYIMVGGTSSNDGDVSGNHGGGDAWLVKLDASGQIQWQKCYGGSMTEAFQAVLPLQDGGYIASGITGSVDGDVSGYHGGSPSDVWMVRVDPTGNLTWQRCLGGMQNDYTQGIFTDRDGNILIACGTTSSDGDITNYHGGPSDGWVVKLDPSGTMLWQRCYGGSQEDYLNEIHPALGNGYYAVGASNSPDGDMGGTRGQADIWLAKISVPDGLDDAASVINAIRVYPTVTRGMVQVCLPVSTIPYSITAYNSLGQQMTMPVTGTGTERQLHFGGLPAGMYLLRITIGNQSRTCKISYLP